MLHKKWGVLNLASTHTKRNRGSDHNLDIVCDSKLSLLRVLVVEAHGVDRAVILPELQDARFDSTPAFLLRNPFPVVDGQESPSPLLADVFDKAVGGDPTLVSDPFGTGELLRRVALLLRRPGFGNTLRLLAADELPEGSSNRNLSGRFGLGSVPIGRTKLFYKGIGGASSSRSVDRRFSSKK